MQSNRQGAAARVPSIDIARGVVMILMAIDHVRVYSGIPAGGRTIGVFFTRWITNFVAPWFVFLAGTAIYLHGRGLAPSDRLALSKYLVTRGTWLVVLELTVIRVAWTFNFDFAHYLLAGVIWVIGWCMITMAAVVHLRPFAIGLIGAGIMALHNVTNFFVSYDSFGASGPPWLLKLLYFGGTIDLSTSGPSLVVLYTLVPWIGVMMAGYAFGLVMTMTPDRRRRVCLRTGFLLSTLFLIIRGADVYGDPERRHRPPESTVPAASPPSANRPPPLHPALRFIATTKYPASLSFLVMTLSPMFIVLGLAERWKGRTAEVLATFGRVPMFYYLLHLLVIHALACVVSVFRNGHVVPWLLTNHPMQAGPKPAGYDWSLPLLYLVFVCSVAVLYPPSRWYARLKATRKWPWMSYL
jgi:uncharacterized membrane protein